MLVPAIVSVLALAGSASSAVVPVDPRTVPDCIRQCSIKATQAVGCKSPLDLQCVCVAKQNEYRSAAVPCLLSNQCNLSQALDISGRLCTQPLGSGVACPTEGWAMCGDICIDLSVQTCASGVPVNNQPRRRRSVTICEPHERMCQVGQMFGSHNDQSGYECLDIYNNLEACGGCPGEGGVDCTALYGVADVSCRGATLRSVKRVFTSSMVAASKCDSGTSSRLLLSRVDIAVISAYS